MIQRDRHDTNKASEVMDLIAQYFCAMTPQNKDRLMQIHLAQARGSASNARLLCATTAMMLRARQINEQSKGRHGNESDL